MNSNVKSIWNQIKVNGIDGADGDVVEAGATEFGITADEMFFTVLLAFLEYKFSYVHIQKKRKSSFKMKDLQLFQTVQFKSF